MAPDQTPVGDQWSSLTCILPDCGADLAVRWELYAPLVFGELSPDADPLVPGDAVAGGWHVECERGHVILVPGPMGANSEAEEALCGDDLCDHDHDDESRQWRRSDVDRLAALLRSAGVLPAAEPAESDPFDHTLTVCATAWSLDHPAGCPGGTCPTYRAIVAELGNLMTLPDGQYRVGVNDLGDRLLIGDRIDPPDRP